MDYSVQISELAAFSLNIVFPIPIKTMIVSCELSIIIKIYFIKAV